MKNTCISRSTFFVSFCLISVCSFSESIQNSVQPETSIISDSILHTRGIAMEIYKIRSHRKYILPKNKLVRVYCYNQKGHMRLKQAHITEISNDQITFTPTSKKFDEVTYSESTLSYIQFTTAGTIVRGIIVNAAIISATVVITAIVVMGSILTGSSSGIRSSSYNWIKLDDFHKHIRFYNLKGDQKWGIRIIETAQKKHIKKQELRTTQ